VKTDTTVLELDRADFAAEVLRSDRPVLVDFWADWCQPCHMLAPTIHQVAEQYGDRVKVAKVNIDDAQELALTHSINSIPTVLVFDGGEVTDRIVGVQAIGEYTAALDARLD